MIDGIISWTWFLFLIGQMFSDNITYQEWILGFIVFALLRIADRLDDIKRRMKDV